MVIARGVLMVWLLVVIHIYVFSYLALAYLNGDSAKAAKMIVPPEALREVPEYLIFIPFETKSTASNPVASAELPDAIK